MKLLYNNHLRLTAAHPFLLMTHCTTVIKKQFTIAGNYLLVTVFAAGYTLGFVEFELSAFGG